MPCCRPIRSSTTVAGMSGHTSSSSRISGSAASTIDRFGARSYFGGRSLSIFSAATDRVSVAE
jgi:hypothetical protein